METVNEKSTAYLTFTFKDKAGNLAAPSGVTYQIDDVATGLAVRAPTPLAGAATLEITLTPADNAILNTAGYNETRRVTITASYGASDQVTDEYLYEVINRAKIT